MTLFVAVEAFNFGQVWGWARLGHITFKRSSFIGSDSCTGIHWHGYVVKVPWGVGRVVLRTWRLSGRGVLSPVLIRSEGGALTLVCASAHGRESIAKGDINAVPGICGVDRRLS